jgi:hypothetical protein
LTPYTELPMLRRDSTVVRLLVAMDGLPEAEYRVPLSRQFGFLLIMAMLLVIPFTLSKIKERQASSRGNYNIDKCIARPSCLDTSPTCTIPQPLDGWCPRIAIPKKLSSTPTPSIPDVTTVEDTCDTCRAHTQHYLCLNQRSNKHFCFTVPIIAPGYSCKACTMK